MPAAATAPVPDKAAVRVLAASVGQREAARQLRLSPNTVKSICFRAGDRKRLASVVPTMQPAAHPNAPNPVEAHANAIAESKQASLTALSSVTAKIARKWDAPDAELPEPEKVNQLASAHAKLHGNQSGSEAAPISAIQINISA